MNLKFKKRIKIVLKRIILRILSPEEPPDKKLEGAIVVGENKSGIIIGNHVSFGGNVFIHADAQVEIGDNTMIAYGCKIHSSTHNYNDHPMWYKRIDRPIRIGKHVWIGTGAIILGGVIVEDYAVIGAGSVITKNVPAGAIIIGNPAKIFKFRDPNTYFKPQTISDPKEAMIVKGFFLNDYYTSHIND